YLMSVTPSFDLGDWFCGVCQRKIENEHGGYSRVKNGCWYAAHSRWATQSNDISDGIIQHFLHEKHHLKLDLNTGGDYDENKQCQACITPIYFGNFYSCLKCDFILHEECANMSQKIHHLIHPHLLTLLGGYDSVIKRTEFCAACPSSLSQLCDFQLRVQCAIISEHLVHESHVHPLFLTFKPEERRVCCVCEYATTAYTNETFNCIECNFVLCYSCPTLPERVMYKHDKHIDMSLQL
ncbi:hypothetical protein EUTSA_v10012227mg, partial [Eutrema salsugineum]